MGANSNDRIYTLVEGMVDNSKNGSNNGNGEELLVGDDEGESSVASVEDQIRNEMTVYEVSDLTNISICCYVDTICFTYTFHHLGYYLFMVIYGFHSHIN